MPERDQNHPLIEFAKRYRKTNTSRITSFRAADFEFVNQLWILRTTPSVLVRPQRPPRSAWEGEPYASRLIAFTGDNQELRFEQSLIEEPLIIRLLSRDDLNFLSHFVIPEE